MKQINPFLKRISRNFRIGICLLSIFLRAGTYGIDLDQFSINGFTSLELNKQVDKYGEGNPNLSFNADLFDLLLNFQIGEKIRATADLSWEHGTETENNYGSSGLEYAFLEHTLIDEIKLRIGKILTPFGAFNEIHRAKPAYFSVNVPMSTAIPGKLAPLGYPFFPRAGVGLAIQGEAAFEYSRIIEYNLFVANGLQDSSVNPYETDGNASKSITARIRYNILDDIHGGMSFHMDEPAVDSLQILFANGWELEYIGEHFRLLSEFLIGYRKKDDDSFSKQSGFYIQPSYNLDMGLTPYGRFEYFNPQLELSEKYTLAFIMGLHYEISQWYMLKGEVDYYKFGKRSGIKSVAGSGYTEIKMSLVLGF